MGFEGEFSRCAGTVLMFGGVARRRQICACRFFIKNHNEIIEVVIVSQCEEIHFRVTEFICPRNKQHKQASILL